MIFGVNTLPEYRRCGCAKELIKKAILDARKQNRTGDDTSGRIWERTRRMGVNTLAFRLPQHNAFYHIDALVLVWS